MRIRTWSWGVVLLLAAILLGAGSTTVGPGEVLVVRRLGRVIPEPWRPGWHWSWPLGIDRTTRIRLDEVRRHDFGRVEPAGPTDDPGAGEFLAGDQNLLRARGVVHFRVADPIAFALRTGQFEPILTRLVEASLARALASRGIDAPLRSGRAEVAAEVGRALARSVDALGLGVEILGVNLTDARPPVEVEPAFIEAQAAQSGRDRRINEARALSGATRPVALAAAGRSIDEARSRADRAGAMAKGQADRFLSLLAEADRSRALTVSRLYRDALRDLLPRVRRKVLMTPEEPVDLGLFGPNAK